MQDRIPSWDSVNSLISSGKRLSDLLKGKMNELIEQSNERLAPLQDPLYLDFMSNRWFAGIHEEHYSDWLAWIIEQLNDPKLVFRLLEIHDLSKFEACVGKQPKINREVYVKKGHEGQTGRLDIKVQFGSTLLIVVEVKLTDAESADLKKNDGYYESIMDIYRKEQHRCKPECKLLVTDAKKPAYNKEDSFKVLKWKGVCMGLRRMASDLSVKESLVRALMLAFAGAIEQNLLKLPPIKSQLFHSKSIDYLQDFLSGGKTND